MPRGGYRPPANPAAVSGPGQHSRRTDGAQPVMNMGNGQYGNTTALNQLQAAAPLAQVASPSAAATPAAPAADPLAALTGLGAPTQFPDQPVTHGAAAGPGAGPEALGLPTDPRAAQSADAQALAPYLQAMIYASQSDSATPAFRRYVRQLIANQP